jgi:hypothetical protein
LTVHPIDLESPEQQLDPQPGRHGAPVAVGPQRAAAHVTAGVEGAPVFAAHPQRLRIGALSEAGRAGCTRVIVIELKHVGDAEAEGPAPAPAAAPAAAAAAAAPKAVRHMCHPLPERVERRGTAPRSVHEIMATGRRRRRQLRAPIATCTAASVQGAQHVGRTVARLAAAGRPA